jgi:TolB-like protein
VKTRARFPLRRFWDELRRRHVVRVLIYYAVFAWVVIQVGDVMLEAFELSHLMRYLVAGVVAVFPVTLALSWMFDLTPGGLERTQPLPQPVAAPAGSLAVLPFANLSDDVENEYFSDGLSEEIRNQLAAVPGLKVAARSSSFAFKGRHEDAREIGGGSTSPRSWKAVRKQGDAVRISVQLVGTADGYQVWSENYERRLEDVFRLQREIAAAVIEVVTPLSGACPAAAAGNGPRNFDAFNLYLRGRHYFHKRTEAALRRAVGYVEQAIELDPEYAHAYAGLAMPGYCSARVISNRQHQTAASAPRPARAGTCAAPAEAHASLGLGGKPRRPGGCGAAVAPRPAAQSRLHDGAGLVRPGAGAPGPLPGSRPVQPRCAAARSAVADHQHQRWFRRAALG